MRIAFVGKGGAGKTSVTALFAQHAAAQFPVLAVDADLNIHLPLLLGIPPIAPEEHLSHPAVATALKTYLRGTNARIRSLPEFRKTTPPGDGSNLIHLTDPEDPMLLAHARRAGENLRLLIVGSYEAHDIGASCYHNDLAILENVLSHLVDSGGILVADMVAGVDAFASSLHLQFDLLVLVVEPTQRGVEVYHQYAGLSEAAGTQDALVVVGNKVRDDADRAFLASHIPASRLIGSILESTDIRRVDREGGSLDPARIDETSRLVLEHILGRLMAQNSDPDARLHRLHELHRRYVAQDFIRERFGDLTSQIDASFRFRADEPHGR